MTEVVAVLAAAALFALFGLFVRSREGCAGEDACNKGEGRSGCGGSCWFRRTETESPDA